MDFRGIRDKIRQLLGDVSAARWTDNELDVYINEGQREYARRSLTLVGSVDVTASDDGIYSVPADFLAFKKFVSSQKNIPCISWQSLAKSLGSNFLTDSIGDVLYICLDLHSWNQYRFYPNQTAGASVGTFYYARTPVDDVIEVAQWEPVMYYAIAQCYLREGEDFIREAQHYLELFKKSINTTSHSDSSVSIKGRQQAGIFF